MEGTPFGRYRLVELLGRGGMGEVWRAYDTETNNRTVAIKVLPPHLADDATFAQRFRREADAAARLNNPHIIPIHTYGEIDGRLYVDMRLVEGRDLQAVLTDGPLQPSRAVRIIDQVAKALHAAHKVGLVHRDVKPSNVLLDEDDFAYLIDFGIARAADDTRMTGTGNAIGTFQYMAPERLGGDPDDARADIYALACVLYECLTGQPPFPGTNMASLVAAHLNTPPPQPSFAKPDVPEQLDAVIATGMAKNPDQRYATTVELSTAADEAITVPDARVAEMPPGPTLQATVPAPNANGGGMLPAEQVGMEPVAVPTLRAADAGVPAMSRPDRSPEHVSPTDSTRLRTPPRVDFSARYEVHPPRRMRKRLPVLAAIGAVIAIAIAGVISLLNRGPNASESIATSYPPAVAVKDIDTLLLSAADLNRIMGTTGLVGGEIATELFDGGTSYSPPECRGVVTNGDPKQFAQTGLIAMREQNFNNTQRVSVGQDVYQFRTEEIAAQVADSLFQSWRACRGKSITQTASGNSESLVISAVGVGSHMLNASIVYESNSEYRCQHIIRPASVFLIDVIACPSPSDQAQAIASEISARTHD